MTRRTDARLTSEVRSHQQRAELLQEQVEPRRLEAGDPQRRTTRFRLEKISLLPFVPGPLVAYVERARGRRRARLLAVGLGAFVALGFALFLLVARTDVQSDAELRLREVPAEPAIALESDDPGLESEPELDGVRLSEAPDEVTILKAGSRENSAPASVRKPHEQARRHARQPRPSSSSAWWW